MAVAVSGRCCTAVPISGRLFAAVPVSGIFFAAVPVSGGAYIYIYIYIYMYICLSPGPLLLLLIRFSRISPTSCFGDSFLPEVQRYNPSALGLYVTNLKVQTPYVKKPEVMI